MDQILATILNTTYTLTQLKHRVKVLKSFLETQLFTNKHQQELNNEDLAWLTSLGGDFYKQFNKDNIYKKFSEIDKKVAEFSPLLIYLPFETNNQVISEIGQYLRSNFKFVYLFDAKFDSRLIAGCALSWKGVLRDYSLRSRIDQRKEEVLRSFKKFLR